MLRPSRLTCPVARAQVGASPACSDETILSSPPRWLIAILQVPGGGRRLESGLVRFTLADVIVEVAGEAPLLAGLSWLDPLIRRPTPLSACAQLGTALLTGSASRNLPVSYAFAVQ
jgi:hypothetical protein